MPATEIHQSSTLTELFAGIADMPPIPFSGIASDSRLVHEGDLFIACAGLESHGLDYLADVVDKNVAVVVYDKTTAPAPAESTVPLIGVEQLASLQGEVAARFYGRPSESMRVMGVTGTNGKTTVAWLAAHCLSRLGRPCAYLGTLGAGINELTVEPGLTTPGAVELHRRLAEFKGAGATQAAIEVSSHAIDQGRISGVKFDTAILTNLSRDHLDYHGNMQAYGDAKARLFFDEAPENSIINIDSPYGADLHSRCRGNAIAVSVLSGQEPQNGSFLRVDSASPEKAGFDLSIRSSWGSGTLFLPLPGEFNIQNAMLVMALLLNQGVDIADACEVMADVEAPPGRMQQIAPSADSPVVVVDYAHTPDALEKALQALQAHSAGKVWCVFGCGGDRDSGKRPEMGRIAERNADRLVVTNDNPRSESPGKIIDAVVRGISDSSATTVIEDRATAIAWAIEKAGCDDVILVAGKGHENYQLIGGERQGFSDVGVAMTALRRSKESES